MKKVNGILILSIFLAIVAVFLIVLSFFVDNTSKSNMFNNISENNNSNNNNSTYQCKVKLEQGGSDYDIYRILNFTVVDGLVLDSESMMYMVFSSDDIYSLYKNNDEYKDKIFDDKNKTITYSNNDKIDLTVDSTGEKLELKFDDHEKSLNNIGYICSQVQ